MMENGEGLQDMSKECDHTEVSCKLKQNNQIIEAGDCVFG